MPPEADKQATEHASGPGPLVVGVDEQDVGPLGGGQPPHEGACCGREHQIRCQRTNRNHGESLFSATGINQRMGFVEMIRHGAAIQASVVLRSRCARRRTGMDVPFQGSRLLVEY